MLWFLIEFWADNDGLLDAWSSDLHTDEVIGLDDGRESDRRGTSEHVFNRRPMRQMEVPLDILIQILKLSIYPCCMCGKRR